MSKKLIAFALAGLFVFSAVSVKADTISDLQAQITAMLAQITALQAQIAGTGTGMVCFNTDLSKGMTANDVKNLQIVLNKNASTQVALSGAGSSGNETTYFGLLTFAAVKNFQASKGIINTGYVGPLTRAALNALYCVAVTPVTTYPAGCTSAVGFSTTTGLSCSAAVTYPAGCTSAVGFSPTTGLSCAGTVTYPAGCTSAVGFSPTTGLSCATVTPVGPSYGTLSVVTYPVSNPVTTLYGGQTYELLDAQYKASGSDITLRQVPVRITSPTFPWGALSTISLWDGATKLVETAVTQANLMQTTFGSDYKLNLGGFNWVIPNGQQKVLTVKTTLASAVPSASAGSYGFSLPVTGVVYADTAGVTYTSIDTLIGPQSYTVSTSNQPATFVVSLNTNNPLENNIIGSTTAVTRQTVLAFDVLNNSTINATFNSATTTVTNSGNIVSYELWDGTNQIASVAAPVNTTSTIVSWSNFTLPIAANTTKVFTVKAVIAQLTAGYTSADTVLISNGPVLTGIDANSNLVRAVGSTLVGLTQHIYLQAPVFTFTTSNKTVTGSNPNSGKTNDVVDATITFTVTASNNDIYLADATNTKDILTTTSTLSSNLTCNSPAVIGANAKYRIPQATTATCSVTSHWANTNATPGYAAVKLYGVVWNTLDYSTGTLQIYGFTTFKTDTFYLGI